MSYKKVTAIILNWNGMRFIQECLESLYIQTYDNLEVFFVDNGSRDSSKFYVWEHFPWVKTIILDKNQGFEIPNNIAMRRALSEGADYIFLMNNDVVLAPDAIAELIEVGEQDPAVGALGPVQVRYDNPTKVVSAGGYFDWKRGIVVQYEKKPFINQEVSFLSGAVLMLKKPVIEHVGMLDEEYYFYGEDVDLSTEIKKNKYKLICVASSIVRHHVRGSTVESSFHIYHITRARLLLMRKHASIFHWLYFVPFFIKNSILGDYLWYLRHYKNDEATAMIRAIIDFFQYRISSKYSEPVTSSNSDDFEKSYHPDIINK